MGLIGAWFWGVGVAVNGKKLCYPLVERPYALRYRSLKLERVL